MDTARVVIDFSRGKYSDMGLVTKSNFVIEKMTGNPSFTTPVISLTSFRESVDRFIVLYNKALEGTKEDTVLKNSQREVIEFNLKQLGKYVQLTSEGDEAMILSSGFDVAKKPVPIGPLEQATGLKIKTGSNKGSVSLSCDIVDQASFYEFEYTAAPITPESIWQKQTSTKHRTEITGLTSGKQYAFRVAGAGADPLRSWSDEVITFIV